MRDSLTLPSVAGPIRIRILSERLTTGARAWSIKFDQAEPIEVASRQHAENLAGALENAINNFATVPAVVTD